MPTMSIRMRILAACLTLTVVTAALGVFTLKSQHRLGVLSLRLYDQAFMSVDFFRLAQTEFGTLRAAYLLGHPEPELRETLGRAIDAMAVAVERASSADARRIAAQIAQELRDLDRHTDDFSAGLEDLGRIVPLFERGSEQFAQDGFAFRLQAEAIAAQNDLTGKIAIGASLTFAALITYSLSRSIVPPLRQATAVARAIAQGKLDNPIAARGSEEIALLLGALAVMQAALAKRHEAAKQIEHMAHHDALTGLANRLAFSAAMDRAVDAAPTDGPFTLLLIDLDRFKPVNDQYGHLAGDELLRAVASRLRRCAVAPDLVSRLGGDEFAVLHRNSSPDSGDRLAEAIVAALAAPYPLRSGVVHVSASVGVDSWSDHGGGTDQLMRNADVALYAAKAAGRGAWRRHAPFRTDPARRAAAASADPCTDASAAPELLDSVHDAADQASRPKAGRLVLRPGRHRLQPDPAAGDSMEPQSVMQAGPAIGTGHPRDRRWTNSKQPPIATTENVSLPDSTSSAA